MGKVGFDDKDYSVVVKNRGGPSKPMEVGDLSSRQIDLLSDYGGGKQGRQSSAQAAIG